MPFKIHKTQENFSSQVQELKKISTNKSVYLNTKLKGSSEQDKKITRWLKRFISFFPKLHIAQTSPVRVAREIGKFAEKHQKFLGEKDQSDLIGIVQTLKIEDQNQSELKKINAVISKIQSLSPINREVPEIELNEMPPEVLEIILTFMDDEIDYLHARQVDSRWNEVSLEAAKIKERLLLQNVIQVVIHYCKSKQNSILSIEDSDQPDIIKDAEIWKERITLLEKLKKNIRFSKSESFPQLQKSIFIEKLKFVGFIHSFDDESINILKREIKALNLPWLFYSIFDPKTFKIFINSIKKLLEEKKYVEILEFVEFTQTTTVPAEHFSQAD
ncbi:F-box protein [Parachlamydia acanthamoebae]|uniref:F-box protein n=1 Tax=Parachlamydia acanthamoebae TaxID=83552 RepID=UPI0024E246B0|nr:F-box protein [Parachlamydia acanthamoebae]